MKKLLAALCLALSTPAFAATTWSTPAGGSRAIATCTTGTEAAPSAWSDGLPLWGIKGFAVHITAGGATAAGTLQAYLYNSETGAWSRTPDLDLAVPAGVTSYAWSGFAVTARAGRIAFLPNGLGAVAVAALAADPAGRLVDGGAASLARGHGGQATSLGRGGSTLSTRRLGNAWSHTRKAPA